MVAPLVAAAAISAGASMLNNAYSNAQSKKMMEKQFSYQKKMWEMENEYNKPINQMARLQEAGLNPNLVYGNGATATGGDMGSVSQPSVKPLDIDPLSDMANYQSIMNMMSQEKQTIDATKNQNELTKADLEIKEQQAQNLIDQGNQVRANTLYTLEQVRGQKLANGIAGLDLIETASVGGPRMAKVVANNLEKMYQYDNMPLYRNGSLNLTGASFGGQFSQ